IGEIWFSGPSVAAGYWKNPDATATTFNAVLPGSDRRYLRTGDYGFIHGCELFITGRLKDCIVIRGRNHYPQDIEWTAEGTHDAVRTGGCVAFSIDHQDDEKLIIVAEINRKSRSELAGVIEAIREAVTREHEIQAFAVVLIQAGALPKTSSGKVQRQKCKASFLQGSLNVLAQDVLRPADQTEPEPELECTKQSILAIDASLRKSLLESYLRQLV